MKEFGYPTIALTILKWQPTMVTLHGPHTFQLISECGVDQFFWHISLTFSDFKAKYVSTPCYI
jgi:hypothetical protein